MYNKDKLKPVSIDRVDMMCFSFKQACFGISVLPCFYIVNMIFSRNPFLGNTVAVFGHFGSAAMSQLSVALNRNMKSAGAEWLFMYLLTLKPRGRSKPVSCRLKAANHSSRNAAINRFQGLTTLYQSIWYAYLSIV